MVEMGWLPTLAPRGSPHARREQRYGDKYRQREPLSRRHNGQPTRAEVEQTPEDAVLADYLASLDGPGKPLSQRFLAEKYGMDRRKVKQIISTVAQPEPV